MKYIKAWIVDNINPELLNVKNATGMLLVLVSVIVFFVALDNETLTSTKIIIAAAVYVAGMVLIVIPRRK